MNSYIKEVIERQLSININSIEEINIINIEKPEEIAEFLFSYKNEFIYIDRTNNLILIAEDYKYIFTKKEQVKQLAFYTDKCSVFKYQI